MTPERKELVRKLAQWHEDHADDWTQGHLLDLLAEVERLESDVESYKASWLAAEGLLRQEQAAFEAITKDETIKIEARVRAREFGHNQP